jgi:hypothetical protein
MVAGLTLGEELDLTRAENQRYRAAVAIAMQGLSTARDRGFEDAAAVIASIDATLAPRPAMPPPRLYMPRVAHWGARLLGWLSRRGSHSATPTRRRP